jgi:copper transport protein
MPTRVTLRRRWGAALLLAVVALLGLARPASAHAVLLSTTPADRSALDAAPAEVSLEFNEDVSATLGSVRAFDDSGDRVDEGDLVVEGSRIRLGLRDGLGDGAYVVTYRILSADAHPVTGAFAFTVGDVTAADDGTIAGLLGEDDDRTWEIAGAAVRFVEYGGALLAAGLGAFLVLAHDGGPEAPRLRRGLRLGAAAGAAGVLAALPIQAALATGLGIGALFEPGVAKEVLGDGVGLSSVLVLAGLLGLAVDAGARRVPTVLAAVAATVPFALAGHTASADPRLLVTVAIAVHLVAAAVWFGGLVGLVAVLRARRGDDAASAGPVVGRFSALAGLSLLGVAVGGSLMGWREVRTLDALTGTTYGKVLIAKVAVVALVAALGGWNRFRLVPAIASAPKKAGALLRRGVRIEGGLLVGAIALTDVLVNVTPARTAAGIGGIFSDTVEFGDGSVNVVVDPNRAGANELHLYVFDDAGRVSDQVFDDLTVRLTLPAAEVGPLEREPYVAGPGHYQVDGSDLSIAGDWTVEVVGRVNRFDQITATVTVPVNP